VRIERSVIERKLACYAAPFTLRRTPKWFQTSDSDLHGAIENDLGRFLPPEFMTVCRNDGYRRFLDAVKGLFVVMREIGVVIPS
jgi:hypothetical protein